MRARMPIAVRLLCCVGLAGLALAQGPGVLREDGLPLKKVVLYKHGVGYFERQGSVSGEGEVTLSFKSAQMKDVLKSLFAVDLSGGRVTSIAYEGKDPLSRQLEEILVQVPENAALSRFLQQLRGTVVSVSIGGREVRGTILGIEPVQKQGDRIALTAFKLVLLLPDGVIMPLDLLDLSALRIEDASVRQELERLMDLYARARRTDRKEVRLHASGEGARELRVGYVIETPIWKTSYRLLLDADKPALIQGWAIAENRTEEDWRDVRLSFVAGNPVSFVMDLYTSYYPKRPVIEMTAAAAEPARPSPAPRPPGAPPPPAEAAADRAELRAHKADWDKKMRRGEVEMEKNLGELFEASAPPMAAGEQVGELFAYTATEPVSIKQGEAALVPILLERIPEGKRVLHFRPGVASRPSHAYELINGTGMTLEKGPVTVFESGTCLGEGLLGRTLKPKDREMIAFALEPGVEVEPQSAGRPLAITAATVANGVLRLQRKNRIETTWRIRNRTQEARTLVLDHPRAGGDHRLVQPAKADDEVPGSYRFRVELAPDTSKEVVVAEEEPVVEEVMLLSQSAEQIRFYLRQPYVSERARAFLESIAVLLDQRAATAERLNQARQERESVAADQKRLRENMGVLRDNARELTVREQYLDRLLKAEQRLEALDKQIAEDTRKLQEIEQRLAAEVQAFRE